MLRAAGHEIVDFGAHTLDADDDYPDFVVTARRGRGGGTGGTRRGDLRQRRRRVGLRQQGRRASAPPSSTITSPRSRGSRTITSTSSASADGRSGRAGRLGSRRRRFLGAEFSQADRHLRRLAKVARMEALADRPAREGCERCSPRPRRSTSPMRSDHATRTARAFRWAPRSVRVASTSACSRSTPPACSCCFFDRVDAATPTRVVDLDPRTQRSYHYWHAFVPGITAGQLYGYRVDGPFDPEQRTSLRSRQGAARSLRQVRGAAGGLEPRGGVRARRQLRHRR